MERVGDDDDDASKNTSGGESRPAELDELALECGYVRTNTTGNGQKGVGLTAAAGEAWLRNRGRTASILGVDDDKPNGERQGFAYWSGYTPGKRNPDGTLTPLNRDELRVEAAHFRRGALRARERGDAAQAARLDLAADDFERRADQATDE